MAGTNQVLVTSDNVRIVYDDYGEGPAIVMVHGYSTDAGYWHFQKNCLVEAGYRVIALDQRQHGRSDKPRFGQRMSRHGLDLRELLDSLSLKDVSLIGHSFGANVILAMFSLFGTKDVARFVAIDQSPRIINDRSWCWGVKNVHWESAWEQANFNRPFGQGSEPPRPPCVRQIFGQETDDPFDGFDHSHTTQLVMDHFVSDWRDILPLVSIPTWVVTGRHSPYYHYDGMKWLADQFPQGSFTCFEQSGHDPAWHEADAFNQKLLSFLRG
ncbi:alpha/beta hydrolase [Rhizobium sp. BK068]|uniref:alpha/beta fold hydrolase n=1 Tax=Rhizobium sp. BK068 TaxID=2512130 RepID=UPI001046EAC7|nr:alpha/beta hydrolase [Rhizobium sp. BK068]TCM65730.1 pimeloyl-ACP methyl ester carboxylesterase [Rhizobium sp. BK068]